MTLTTPDQTFTHPATTTGWTKWRPSDPTSPHWYELTHLTDLISAYLKRERAGGRARTLREFVAEFHGLSASAKQEVVLDVANLPRKYLHDLVEGDGLRAEEPERLLQAMQSYARPVKPQALGVLGRDHLTRVLTEQHGRDADTVCYKKVLGEVSGVPFALEVALGVARWQDAPRERRVIAGINWSAMPGQVPFEHLQAHLGEALVQHGHPVLLAVHLAMPRPTFRDRGKQALALPEEIDWALELSIKLVTQHWTAAVHRTLRNRRADAKAEEELQR